MIRNKTFYIMVLIFMGIDVFGSTERSLFEHLKKRYDFKKDPNSIYAANNIDRAFVGSDDAFKHFVLIYQKPKADGTFFIKQATFQAYAYDYDYDYDYRVESTINVYRYRQGLCELVKTQVVSGIETFDRLEKLALEVEAFNNGQPSIKTK